MKGKKIKGFDAGELMGTVVSGLGDIAIGNKIEGRDDVFNNKINNHVIDTVCAFDTHIWETGIERDGEWIIVGQYNNRDEAVIGHKKWCNEITKNPKVKLEDIGLLD